ncbi:MAG: protein translocase subunit SecF, partial [Allosphingosinicella sp.]
MRLLKLVKDDTNVDFLKWRNIAFVISSLLIAASIALIAVKGLNFGVDFAGGQMIRVAFQQPPQLDDLRERLGSLGHGEAAVQEFGSPTEIAIRMQLPE